MVYCTKCGAPLKEGDKFCPVCGAPVAKFTREEFTVSGSNVVDRVKDLLHEGSVTRVIVKDEKGNTLLEIPATVGVIGTVIASRFGCRRSFSYKMQNSGGKKRIDCGYSGGLVTIKNAPPTRTTTPKNAKSPVAALSALVLVAVK